MSRASGIAAIGFLLTFGLNLTKSSAARCCASAADPPFPQKKIFPFLLSEARGNEFTNYDRNNIKKNADFYVKSGDFISI